MLNVRFTKPLLRLRDWVTELLLGTLISLLCFVGTADAAKTVTLNFQDQEITIPNQDFLAFANDNKVSEDLQRFFQQTSLTPEAARDLLNETILPSISLKLDRNLNRFLAIQLNKLMSNPEGRESLRDLETVVVSALADDRKFSMLELIDEYPKPAVKVDLGRLDQVHEDVNLFVERVKPILQQGNKLLEDLVCECELEPSGPALLSQAQLNSSKLTASASSVEATSDGLENLGSRFMLKPARLAASGERQMQQKTEAILAEPSMQSFKVAQLAQAGSQADARVAQSVIIQYGPFNRSLSIDELTTLAETGEASPSLKLLLRLAKFSPDQFQTVLDREVKAEFAFLDKNLNNVLGEFALFEVGQIVHTQSGWANIEALRSALLLSARNDNQISLIEFFQNYPLPQVYVNAAKLAKAARLAGHSTRSQNFAISEAQSIEDFLVSLQASVAAEVCNCNAKVTAF